MKLPFCPYQCFRICWKILAGFLVIFALLVSLIRGLLPQLDSSRSELMNFIHDNYQVEVFIGKLSAQWQAYGPSVTIDNLVLPSQDKLPVTLIMQKVQLKLDFWQTLLTMQPHIENVVVEGVHLGVNLDELQQESTATAQVQKQQSSPSNNTKLDWVYSLLLEQLSHYSLSDLRLQLLSKQHDYRPIHIKDFYWSNHGEKHQGQGELRLDDNPLNKENLTLQFDFNGDGYQPETIYGQAYLAANSLDLGEWSSNEQLSSSTVKKTELAGVINLSAWADFSSRKWHSALVNFKPSWLQWYVKNQVQRFDISSGQLYWQNQDKSWSLTSDKLDFSSNSQKWVQPKLDVHFQNDKLAAQINELDVRLFHPLLFFAKKQAPTLVQKWRALSPSGIIGPTKFNYSVDQGVSLSTQITQLSWQSVDNHLGIEPISAKVTLNNDQLSVMLPKQSYGLDFGEGFVAPLQLKGQPITANFDLATNTLSIEDLTLENRDIKLSSKLRLELAADPAMSLAAKVAIKDVRHAFLYFPQQVMGDDLSDYLTSALQGGVIPQANVLWNGQFSDFPYAQAQGIFQAGFDLKDANFRFQPDWPTISQLSLKALFENARMDLWVSKGKLLQVPADGAHVFIADMGDKSELGVKAQIVTNGEDATEVIQSSPLSDSVGKVLDIVQVTGPVPSILDLNIPLYDGGLESIRGQVSLDKNPVYIAQPGIDLRQVTGKVRFHNSAVEGDDIKANLFGQPLDFSFETGTSKIGSNLNVDLSGKWNLDELPAELNNPLSAFYSGQLGWKGNIKMLVNDAGYDFQANVDSNLLGTKLALPQSLSKMAAKAGHLHAEFIDNNQKMTLGIKLNDIAEFWGQFDKNSPSHLKSYDVIIGRPFKPGDKLAVNAGQLHVDMADAELEQWLPLITAFTDEAETSYEQELAHAGNGEQRSHFFPELMKINSKIDRMKFAGQTFKHLEVHAKPEPEFWSFDVKSSNFDGQLHFYPDYYQQGISINADKLFLFSDKTKPSVDSIDKSVTQPLASIDKSKNLNILSSLPKLKLTVKDFRFYNKHLGTLEFDGMPENGNYVFNHMALDNGHTQFIGSGQWLKPKGENTGATVITGTMAVDKFDNLSKQMDITPGVKDSPFNTKLDLHWQGAPYDFHLSRLNGDIDFELGKGHLSEVSDQGARIFSLFSLSSLVRKLSLDFSDVFGKGLYFNKFDGKLRIDDGVIKTTNTVMDAVAGTMKVRGYTDLTKQSLNYDIRFAPALASSVPTVVLLSTSAWTLGIGAFALTKVLEPVIEVISEIRFRVTGTMSNPKLEELERKSKEIEIPKKILKEAYPDVIKLEPILPETNLNGEKEASSNEQLNKNLNNNLDENLPKLETKQSVQPIKTVKPEVVVPPKLTSLKAANASQFITMSKWSRCSAKPELYSSAA
ncbi:MAG: YhdP family protein [Parashewanella sp.]